ncbi:hypothetical protein B0T25DRAFT_70202 [Lasiosphaeria hispida]|uniref:Uncharacterized protein n=1 Tax=Lasiosphaeria hispida TaxID=260671 RepID=A0AAJ0MLG6_9PEZI|nr:hypothetical protein B0T25DRAFT_70202 [Lasiosphaeria hispida]
MNSLSVPNYCANLQSGIDVTHSELRAFVLDVRSSYVDIDAVRRELLSIQTLLELIEQDSKEHMVLIPRNAAERIAGIIRSCSQIVNEVQVCISEHGRPEDKAGRRLRWVKRGRKTMVKLIAALWVHRTSLLLALNVITLIIVRANRMNPNRAPESPDGFLDSEEMGSNTDPILGRIHELQAMLPSHNNTDSSSSLILYSDVDELSSYAESIADGSILSNHFDEYSGDSPSQAPKSKSELKPKSRIFDEGSDYGSVQNNGSIAETESTEARSPDPPRLSVLDISRVAEYRPNPKSGIEVPKEERERRRKREDNGPRAKGRLSGIINDLHLGTPTAPHTPRDYTFEAARLSYASTHHPIPRDIPRAGGHDQLKHVRTSSIPMSGSSGVPALNDRGPLWSSPAEAGDSSKLPDRESSYYGVRQQSSEPSMRTTGARSESNKKEESSHPAASSQRPRRETPYYETPLRPQSPTQRATIRDNLWRTQTTPATYGPRLLRASKSQEQVPRPLTPVPAPSLIHPASGPMPPYPSSTSVLTYSGFASIPPYPASAPMSNYYPGLGRPISVYSAPTPIYPTPALKSILKPSKTQQSSRSEHRQRTTSSSERRPRSQQRQTPGLASESSVAAVVGKTPKSERGQSNTRRPPQEQAAKPREPSSGTQKQKREDGRRG